MGCVPSKPNDVGAPPKTYFVSDDSQLGNDTGEWICLKCAFLNKPDRSVCEICNQADGIMVSGKDRIHGNSASREEIEVIEKSSEYDVEKLTTGDISDDPFSLKFAERDEVFERQSFTADNGFDNFENPGPIESSSDPFKAMEREGADEIRVDEIVVISDPVTDPVDIDTNDLITEVENDAKVPESEEVEKAAKIEETTRLANAAEYAKRAFEEEQLRLKLKQEEEATATAKVTEEKKVIEIAKTTVEGDGDDECGDITELSRDEEGAEDFSEEKGLDKKNGENLMARQELDLLEERGEKYAAMSAASELEEVKIREASRGETTETDIGIEKDEVVVASDNTSSKGIGWKPLEEAFRKDEGESGAVSADGIDDNVELEGDDSFLETETDATELSMTQGEDVNSPNVEGKISKNAKKRAKNKAKKAAAAQKDNPFSEIIKK